MELRFNSTRVAIPNEPNHGVVMTKIFHTHPYSDTFSKIELYSIQRYKNGLPGKNVKELNQVSHMPCTDIQHLHITLLWDCTFATTSQAAPIPDDEIVISRKPDDEIIVKINPE